MTQGQRLLEHLEQGKTITRLNAWEKLGILEAPARICELRQKGHSIETKMVPVFNRFGEAVRVARWSMDSGVKHTAPRVEGVDIP